jgi:hypothetical protein
MQYTHVPMLTLCTVLLGLPLRITPASAQQRDTTRAATDTLPRYLLAPLVIEGRRDDLTGIARSASQGFIGYRDFKLRPLVREGELLETVPGLIMTQHSGDGKSNQMFVRGFNLDHGTDFSTRLEGMPVNIPTHAHGQGYTDLNFIIPEMVDHVEYKLGPYYADIGDFGAAGGADLRLRRSLDRPLALVSLGENGFRRAVVGASMPLGPGRFLAGAEFKEYDGPWAVAQDLGKRAGVLRYSWERGSNAFSIIGLGYDNAWNASDQVPKRLIESGALNRFAQIDSSLGGSSSRYAVAAEWMRTASSSSQRLQLYGMRYDLDLYSNFTYFLDDPDNGDQIQQRDRARKAFGGDFAYSRMFGLHTATLGLQTRLDFANVALRRADDRDILTTVRADDVTQWANGGYLEVRSRWTPRLRTVLGLRGDAYRFDVTSDRSHNSGTASDAILSPKASIAFEAADGFELYLSGGFGFHSNDARGVVQSVDPVTGEAVDPVPPLARSRGAEVGLRATRAQGLRSNLVAWTVELESELLFVGDAGTTEASAGSRRFGITWANFWLPLPQLRLEADASFAHARFHELEDGENRIPGALERVVSAGIAWEPPATDGPFAALRLRHFGEYPLTEDNSIRATATSLLNLNAGWVFRGLRIGVHVLNLLDSAHSDISYFYASRLGSEPAGGIEDVHFHPVEPRQIRLTFTWGH